MPEGGLGIVNLSLKVCALGFNDADSRATENNRAHGRKWIRARYASAHLSDLGRAAFAALALQPA
jgi:hypothetical protein